MADGDHGIRLDPPPSPTRRCARWRPPLNAADERVQRDLAEFNERVKNVSDGVDEAIEA